MPETTTVSLAGAIAVDLIAVLVAVVNGSPSVLTVQNGDALPSGPFEDAHRSLQTGLRIWVEEQTHHPLGYVEQLYTFADRDRSAAGSSQRVISISYLGLTRETRGEVGWRSWYDYFPWEDHRDGPPVVIAEHLVPRLRDWAQAGGTAALPEERWRRCAFAFGLDGAAWNEELVLQRYELLYEAALVPERVRETGGQSDATRISGRAMTGDHRRILATGIARLRAKIKYRPVVFELMQPALHAAPAPACRRSFGRPARAQAEFPQADRAAGAGRRNRRHHLRHRRAAGKALPLSPCRPRRTRRRRKRSCR